MSRVQPSPHFARSLSAFHSIRSAYSTLLILGKMAASMATVAGLPSLAVTRTCRAQRPAATQAACLSSSPIPRRLNLFESSAVHCAWNSGAAFFWGPALHRQSTVHVLRCAYHIALTNFGSRCLQLVCVSAGGAYVAMPAKQHRHEGHAYHRARK